MLRILLLFACILSTLCEPRVVKLSFNLHRLSKVDVRGKFEAGFVLESSWVEPDHSNCPGTWTPGFIVPNTIRNTKDNSKHRRCEIVDGVAIVTLKETHNYEVKQAYELKDFPVDQHKLRIHLESLWFDSTQVVLEIERFGFEEDILDTDEWRIESMDAMVREVPNRYRRRALGTMKSMAVFSIHVFRLQGFYMYQVAFPAIVISCVSWCGFFLSPTQVMPRVMCVIFAMLTMMQLRSSVASSMPRVSYSTWADMAFLMGWLIGSGTLTINVAVINLHAHDRTIRVKQINVLGRVLMPLSSVVLMTTMLIILAPVYVGVIAGLLGAITAYIINAGEIRRLRQSMDTVAARMARKKEEENGHCKVHSGGHECGPYTLTIRTAKLTMCGTDANVKCEVIGERGTSLVQKLRKSLNHLDKFERGQTDTFVLDLPRHLGPLSSIRLWHDGSGGFSAWAIADVRVTQPPDPTVPGDTKHVVVFLENNPTWLRKDNNNKVSLDVVRQFPVFD